MLSKNKKYIKVIVFFAIIIFIILIGCIYSYRKPIELYKSYNGVVKDIKADKLIGNSNIKLDVNFQKAYIIKKFKRVDRIYGTINIDNKDYDVEGMTIINEKGNYIGATVSENNKSKYYIFILDDFEYILIGEVADDEFIKQIIAPAKNETDFERILQKLP